MSVGAPAEPATRGQAGPAQGSSGGPSGWEPVFPSHRALPGLQTGGRVGGRLPTVGKRLRAEDAGPPVRADAGSGPEQSATATPWPRLPAGHGGANRHKGSSRSTRADHRVPLPPHTRLPNRVPGISDAGSRCLSVRFLPSQVCTCGGWGARSAALFSQPKLTGRQDLVKQDKCSTGTTAGTRERSGGLS